MDELVKRLQEYMDKSGKSQNAVSQEIGVSNGMLSQVLSGKYQVSDSKSVDKIRSFLDIVDKEATLKSKIDFAFTSIVDTLLSTINYCHLQGVIGLIYGDAGIGKTESIKYYAKHNTEAIVINCSPAFSKPKSFLKLVCKKIKVSNSKKTEDDLYMDIVEKLEGTKKILILDEAQHLPLQTLEYVRSIHDDAGIAITLIGNYEIYNKMLGRQEAAFAQLFSRVAIRKHLTTINVLSADIDLLFGTSLEDDSKDYLFKIAKTKWGIRGAVNVYINAVNNNDVSPKGLKGMANYMGIYESR